MLLGRTLGGIGGSPVTIPVAKASLALSGYAPTVTVTFTEIRLHNHFDGTDTSTTYTDQVAGVTWSNSGGELDTAVKKFGTASLRLPNDGASRYAFTGAIPTFDSTADYTIEGWVLYTTNSGATAIMADFESSTVGATVVGALLFNGASSTLTVNGTASSAFTTTVDTWYHMALVHNSSAATLTGYIAGTQRAQKTSFTPGTWDEFILYHSFAGGGAEDVHYDEVRIVQSQVYTGNFTPPSSAF